MSKDLPHIALYLPHLDEGGAEYVMVQLASGFASRGFRTDIVLVSARGTYLTLVPPTASIVDLQASNAYGSFPGLLRYLKNERPNVLLSTLDLTNLIALLAKRISGVDTLVVIRVANTISLQKRSLLKKKIERLLLSKIYPWSDNIVAVSQGASDDLSEYTGIPSNRIRTIHNPIITPQLKEQAKESLDHPWFQSGEAPVILGVGRLTEQKDFPTLIQAFALVRRSRLARLMILGEGEERAKLEALSQEMGIRSEVSMPGYIKNPFPYLREAALFVLSSRWEGLPGVLIQALACGCPVVSTDCPSGPAEILDHGRWGYLVPVRDPEALAEAIMQVLSGNVRKPPPGWLKQFELDPVVDQYLSVMGLECNYLAKPPLGSKR